MSYSLSSGVSEAQGRRDTMEDTHKHIDDLLAIPEFAQISSFKKVAYYAVFDGHGGDQTAKMVENALHPRIFSSEEFSRGDVNAALEKGFEDMDRVVVEEANKNNWMNGSTCVVGLVLDGVLTVANIGDSEGVLISVSPTGETIAQNLTKPHKATDPGEKERIEALGGHVFFGRVFGALAVSRSFGDAKYKKPKTSKDFVSWEPFIESIPLTQDHKFLVLACDGLWDVMTHKEVAELTHKTFNEGKTPSEVARHLVRTALNKKTEDNVTVIVVKIDWKSEGSTEEKKHEHTSNQAEAQQQHHDAQSGDAQQLTEKAAHSTSQAQHADTHQAHHQTNETQQHETKEGHSESETHTLADQTPQTNELR